MDLQTRHLTTLKLDVDWANMIDFGAAAAGRRINAPVRGGSFAGERLSGAVLPGGTDWVLTRADGTVLIDVRLPLRTGDGARLGLSYTGTLLASPEALARFGRGEALGVGEYRLRTVNRFETGDARYAWLNDLLVVGVSGPTTADTQYTLHEIV